ncbi:MAG: phosphate propanoyltransferase [Gemmataceae bacterium]|nr:phosphate propanoyltransferase [Gemmataceae bacterium]
MITLDRGIVERLVRDALTKQLPNAQGRPSLGVQPKLVVNVSARHAHVTPEDLERLFGKGHQLKPFKWLYQDGFYAAEETVTVIGPRQRIIPNVRILGPCRDHSQIELAFTDAVQLGLEIPVRKSGDHRDTPGCWMMGPAGMIRLERGVIRHERHVHVGPKDCEHYGVKDGDRLHLRVKSDCSTVLEDLLVRLSPASKLEVHIDTDEGNAVNYPRATKFELFK